MSYKIAFAMLGMLLAAGALAQQETQSEGVRRVIIAPHGPGEAHGLLFERHIAPGGPPSDMTYQFISSGMSFGGGLVKGAPYSAEATTETIQVLADGNRITRKNTARLYRDSEGRTRREDTLTLIGPWTAAGEPPQMVAIHDPVAGVHYMLDARTRIARKLSLPNLPEGATTNAGPRVILRAPYQAAPAGGAVNAQPPLHQQRPDSHTESLGQQMIGGVLAEGTRTSFTIPAGQIGNDLPISVTSERWYSPELQMVVMTKHSDPRVGATTYQLQDIRRDNPAPSLFEVPPDYTVQEGPVRIEHRLENQR